MFALGGLDMEIIFVFNDNDLAGLDIISEGDKDRLFCVNLCKAFRAGDLHISIDRSCLLTIKYDGEERSFTIKQKECEFFKKSLNGFWQGKLNFRISLFSIWDSGLSKFNKGCNIRFLPLKSKSFYKVDDLQSRLIESYIPPLIKTIKMIEKKEKNNIFIQKKLTGESFFPSPKPLFKASKIFTKQKALM